MKRRASGSQRTGQPRCAQFTENATNSRSPVRRSHAARLGGDPRPRQRRGIDEAHVRRLAELEVAHLAHRAPDDGALPEQRRDGESDQRDGERAAPGAEPDADAGEEPAPLGRRPAERVPGSPGESLLRVMTNLSNPVKQGVEEQRPADERHHE